jgi:hypothetical protein
MSIILKSALSNIYLIDFKGFIAYEFKKWFVRYDANYTSTTYTTTDNNQYLNLSSSLLKN